VTLPQVEKEILKYPRFLLLSPRSDPLRPIILLQLAGLRTIRREFSHQKDDHDKSITHLTEAVILPFQQGRDVVNMLFQLASVLSSRFWVYKQPEDIKSSLKYFRFLRINFHPLEAFDIPHYQLTSRLVRALAHNLKLGFGDMAHDMEEIAALSHELLTTDTSSGSRGEIREDIAAFTLAVRTTWSRGNSTQQPSERVLQVLREAKMMIPDDHTLSLALARCHATRFRRSHAIKEYEEAIAIADQIIGAGDSLTLTDLQETAIDLITELVSFRLNSSADPVYLEESIHRIRSLLGVYSPDQRRKSLTSLLHLLEEQRFDYFGVTGSSVEIPFKFSDLVNGVLSDLSRKLHLLGRTPDGDPQSLFVRSVGDLQGLLTSIRNNEIADVEAAVECGRALLPSPGHRYSSMVGTLLAEILSEAYERTERLDYLSEAITKYRDHLQDGSGFRKTHFFAVYGLVYSLIRRFKLCRRGQDLEEAMQLYAILADHGYTEVFNRFCLSCSWARHARLHAHPSISTAYEKAMSLLQETLVFSPTLQTQHFRLVRMPGGLEGFPLKFPLDYASYQIERGQFKQATETLERGRALLWSEMRGLRTSTDQLRAFDPVIADKFTAINRQLESVTMSVTQSESEVHSDDSETGTVHREGMNSIGRLVSKQRTLLEERITLISHIQSLPGFGKFLKPLSFDALNSAAAHGPVIIINQSEWSSDIIILHKDLSPSIISTPFDLYGRTNQLKEQLLHVRKEKGLDSKDYGYTLASVLADLYELVGKPVIEMLRRLKVPEKSRIWWCPTSTFSSLPLHAMGPIPSDSDDKVYFMDLYISSYTPTLTALIESRKPGSQLESFDKPSLLLVAQPETLPGAWGEIDVIEAVGLPVTTLMSEKATPTTVLSGLRDHRFVHFVCHGLLETGKPFDASFKLHGGNLTLLEIVRSHLSTAEFAFLSACHTAELTDESIADEGLHLAAAVQFCGFRSVVGTMWAMADTDGADLSQFFYKSIFPAESPGRKRVPYYERSARALQVAVKKLRRKRGVTLERWVNFVHYGA
jgi:CHAT domain-containing protein/tetratricopeptide (TPR) repeat protein